MKTLNPAPELSELARRATVLTGATGAAIAILERGQMVCEASLGRDVPQVGLPLNPQHGLSGECIRTQRFVRCCESRTDERVDSKVCEMLGIRSMVIFPVFSSGTLVGVLGLFSDRPDTFPERCEAELKGLIDCCSGVLGRSQFIKAHAIPITSSESVLRNITSFEFRARTYPYVAAIILIVSLYFGTANRKGVGQGPIPTLVHAGTSTLSSVPTRAPARYSSTQLLLDDQYAGGKPHDDTEAFQWFEKAARRGDVPAQSTLATFYWLGQGTPRNYLEAYTWAMIAQAGGDQASAHLLNVLSSQMRPTSVAEARYKAARWLGMHRREMTSATDKSREGQLSAQ